MRHISEILPLVLAEIRDEIEDAQKANSAEEKGEDGNREPMAEAER